METLQINIKEIVQQKSPILAQIPGLMYSLKKLLHEDEINECLTKYGHYQGIKFAIAVLEYFNVKVKIRFQSLLHPQGRYIFAANHPLGGMDGIALIYAVGTRFPYIKFPVNDFLLNLKNFDSIFLPINKHGTQSRKAVEKINTAYASSNEQILIFPAGLVSRKKRKNIMDLPWQKHFIIKAIEYQRDIVPVYIQGENSKRFYTIAQWRKYLGIKFNIEMIFLVDEMFRQKGKTITIIFGTPISYALLDKKSAEEIATHIKNVVYQDLASKIHQRGYTNQTGYILSGFFYFFLHTKTLSLKKRKNY